MNEKKDQPDYKNMQQKKSISQEFNDDQLEKISGGLISNHPLESPSVDSKIKPPSNAGIEILLNLLRR